MRSLSIAKTFATAADWADCRRLLRAGSQTFYAASLVLPSGVRQSAIGLYAFCRVADDAIDLGGDRQRALADLRRRLDRVYAQRPDDNPVDRAFTDVVLRHEIPRKFPDALLEGFEWDAMSRRYETLDELREYALRVAGFVGAMLAMAMGIREPEMIARACDLGVAMQLTNIARDVGEDARIGRLYVPLQWLRETGIEPDSFAANPRFDEALATVIQRLLESAEALYVRSDAGLARLPRGCRPGMTAARHMYAEIGHELARRGFDSITRRTVVPWPRKTKILADALLLSRRPAFGDRVVWLLELFEKLERFDRSQHRVSADGSL
jgi:phytoene synthase